MEGVTIPITVTSIGQSAFSSCYSLTSIVIPDTVTSLGYAVFSGCKNLESVRLPRGITTIGSIVGSGRDADYNTGHLFGYIFGKDSYEGGVQTNQYYGYNSYQYGSFYIPSSLKSVTVLGGNFSRGAFYSCDYITDVTIVDSLSGIGMEAFYSCDSLTNVIINSVEIHDKAFSGCYNLKNVTMNRVTVISYSAFYNCTNLSSITIPGTVTQINSYAFSGCTSLTSVTFANPNGWYYSSNATDTSGTTISAEDLANVETSATYLKSTYCTYTWHREDVAE